MARLAPALAGVLAPRGGYSFQPGLVRRAAMNRLTDYVLGRAVILWRVRHRTAARLSASSASHARAGAALKCGETDKYALSGVLAVVLRLHFNGPVRLARRCLRRYRRTDDERIHPRDIHAHEEVD